MTLYVQYLALSNQITMRSVWNTLYLKAWGKLTSIRIDFLIYINLNIYPKVNIQKYMDT